MSDWFVYIAEMKTGKYYVGISTDPQRRIQEHNTGRGSRLARGQGPFRLLFVSPLLPNRSIAQQYEAELKRWPRAKKAELINGDIRWPELTELR